MYVVLVVQFLLMYKMEDKITHLDKIWGCEDWFANNDLYCGKKLTLKKHGQCSYHYHEIKDETFYIVAGKMGLELEGRKMILNPGDAQRILPGQKHSFLGLEDTIFIEVSTHHEDSDSYRVSGRESRTLSEDKFEE